MRFRYACGWWCYPIPNARETDGAKTLARAAVIDAVERFMIPTRREGDRVWERADLTIYSPTRKWECYILFSPKGQMKMRITEVRPE